MLKFPYGKDFLQIEIPKKQLDVVISHPSDPLKDLGKAVKRALKEPICSKPLYRLLNRDKKICIIVPDITRACPTKEILAPFLEELETFRFRNIEILIGTGLHKKISNADMVELIGVKTVENYHVTCHTATDEKQLVDLKMKTSYGTPTIVNKMVTKSDYLLGIGLVEPHFFAGYSGGRKALLPAVAGETAIFNNHGYKMIGHPNASYGVLDENPIHQDMLEFMKFVNLSFILNVTINNRGETTQVFAGNPIDAHRQAVDFLNHYINVKLQNYAEICIISNGGYPLDRNLYQAVKGMATAFDVIKRGGEIIMLAECKDGLGGHEKFKELMEKGNNPGEVLKEIRENEPIIDQWQAQILARILQKATVTVVTNGVKPNVLRKMKMESACSLEEALDSARKRVRIRKPRIVAIPEGPHVIPRLPTI